MGWRDELESALVLLQEIEAATHRGEGLDVQSVLDGVHALVDRASGDIQDWGERTGSSKGGAQ